MTSGNATDAVRLPIEDLSSPDSALHKVNFRSLPQHYSIDGALIRAGRLTATGLPCPQVSIFLAPDLTSGLITSKNSTVSVLDLKRISEIPLHRTTSACASAETHVARLATPRRAVEWQSPALFLHSVIRCFEFDPRTPWSKMGYRQPGLCSFVSGLRASGARAARRGSWCGGSGQRRQVVGNSRGLR